MKPREEWHLDTQRLGRRVLVFDQLDSTNTYAATLAHDPANGGVVVLADQQTAGRGQYGRSWQAPAETSVLLSALLFPAPELRRPVVLTAWAAVSVCETIRRSTGLQAKIKWPNDVLIRGRKVCGILIEQGRGTVAGIGLNVNQPAEHFAQAGLTQAASLAMHGGKRLDCHAVARLLIEQLDDEYNRLCKGDIATLEACWKWRIGLLGKPVTAECHDAVHHGRLRELAFAGLVLEQPDGQTRVLPPEGVRHLQ